jgi:chromosome segregation ATPase
VKKWFNLAVPVFALVLTVGCQDTPEARKANKDAKREIGEAADATGKALKVQKEEYRKKIEIDLGRLDDQLATYREKLSKATDDMKAEMQKQIDRLQAQRDQVREKLKDLGGDTKEAWEEVKKGLDQAVGNLKDAFSKAKDRFQ